MRGEKMEDFEDGDAQAISIANPYSAQQEDYRVSNRLDELQSAIDIYQQDHDVLSYEQIEINRKIEEKQKELRYLIDQHENGLRSLFRAEKNLRELNKALQKERQCL
jgi:predicted  nucleic acid-binding Zn-ribbon protein